MSLGRFSSFYCPVNFTVDYPPLRGGLVPYETFTQSSRPAQGLLPRQSAEGLKKTLEAKPEEEVLLPRVQGRLWDTCNTSRENWASSPAQSAEVQAGASPLTRGATWESWALETWALKTLSNSLPSQAPQFLGPGTSVAHTQTSRVLTGFLRACVGLRTHLESLRKRMWPLSALSPHCRSRATRR